MKRCQTEDIQTPEWYDNFHFSERGYLQSNPCVDLFALINVATRNTDKILDVGCGMGHYFPHFQSREIHGIELSPKAVAYVRERYPGTFPVAGNVMADGLPYPDNTFDVIYCGEMIEHVEKPHELVAHIKRVLKPGGFCMLNTPFEDKIPSDTHLWYLDRKDMLEVFAEFNPVSLFRFDNSPTRDWWEHFIIIAIKP